MAGMCDRSVSGGRETGRYHCDGEAAFTGVLLRQVQAAFERVSEMRKRPDVIAGTLLHPMTFQVGHEDSGSP